MTDTILIFAVIGVVLAMTLIANVTLGKRIARRSRLLAVLVGSLSIPLLIAILAYADFLLRPGPYPDSGSLALAGSLIYAAITLPFTTIMSAITILILARSTPIGDVPPVVD